MHGFLGSRAALAISRSPGEPRATREEKAALRHGLLLYPCPRQALLRQVSLKLSGFGLEEKRRDLRIRERKGQGECTARCGEKREGGLSRKAHSPLLGGRRKESSELPILSPTLGRVTEDGEPVPESHWKERGGSLKIRT